MKNLTFQDAHSVAEELTLKAMDSGMFSTTGSPEELAKNVISFYEVIYTSVARNDFVSHQSE